MTEHHHAHPVHPTAASPTLSLLRMSALQRVLGACLLLGALWLIVFAVTNGSPA